MMELGDSMHVKFNIIPVPASRPRVTRWSTYYGKKYPATISDSPSGASKGARFVSAINAVKKRTNPRG